MPNDANGAVGMDVYAGARAAGNPVPRFRGQDIIEVRSIVVGTTGEIAGASCTVDSGLYKAAFNSPANVIVPDYGSSSPALFFRCVGPNGVSGSKTVTAFNATQEGRSSSATAEAGILGAIIVGAVSAANVNPESDSFDYPSVSINMQ